MCTPMSENGYQTRVDVKLQVVVRKPSVLFLQPFGIFLRWNETLLNPEPFFEMSVFLAVVFNFLGRKIPSESAPNLFN